MTPLLPIRTIDQEREELKYVLKSQERERQRNEKQRQQNEKERIEAEKERCAAQVTKCAEWKRRACEEVLGLKAPQGRAPMCKETAKNKYSCLDLNCNYKDRTFRLDTYILKLHIMLELLMLIILYHLQIFTYQENDYWLPN